MSRLALPVVVLLAAEIALLVVIARVTSLGFVLAWVLCSAILGVGLARRVGVRTLQQMQTEMAAGAAPVQSLTGGLAMLLAAVLLIIPGVMTDAAAVAILIPPVRRAAGRWVTRWYKSRIEVLGMGGAWQAGQSGTGRDEIIDVRVVDPAAKQITDRDERLG